jgi:hypothetical protein
MNLRETAARSAGEHPVSETYSLSRGFGGSPGQLPGDASGHSNAPASGHLQSKKGCVG